MFIVALGLWLHCKLGLGYSQTHTVQEVYRLVCWQLHARQAEFIDLSKVILSSITYQFLAYCLYKAQVK
jgi:hypothetical protein